MELTFGGIVVDFIVRPTRTGSQFGIMKIEDYSGQYELRLFGQNYINFRQYGEVGMPIIVRGAYQKNKYNERVDLNIFSIDLLENVKGKMIHSITIDFYENEVKSSTSELLGSFLTESTENRSDIFFNIKDEVYNRSIKLKSRFKMPVTKNLVNFLTDQEIMFNINKD